MINGGLGSAGLTAGLDDLQGIFQSKQFHDTLSLCTQPLLQGQPVQIISANNTPRSSRNAVGACGAEGINVGQGLGGFLHGLAAQRKAVGNRLQSLHVCK